MKVRLCRGENRVLAGLEMWQCGVEAVRSHGIYRLILLTFQDSTCIFHHSARVFWHSHVGRSEP